MKKITLFLGALAIAAIPFFSVAPHVTAVTTETTIKKPATKKRFGFLVHQNKKNKYQFVKNTGARWVRPHPGPFVWGKMQTTKNGEIDFTRTDKWVKRAQKQNLSILVTLWPYAEWDQQNKPDHCMVNDAFAEQITAYRCNPKHWKKYRAWVRQVVERYDGDGVDDMPGLTRAIRHWEVNNEPDMGYYSPEEFITNGEQAVEVDSLKSGENPDEDEMRFFVGSPSKYKKLLHNTQKPIRNADSKAKVVIAAPSTMATHSTVYFDELFGLRNIKKKFDIANVHCISSGCSIESFNVEAYKQQLDEHGINKPIWVTEAQPYVSEDPDINAAQLADSIERALELGAKRIIMTHMKFEVPSYEDPGYVNPLPQPLDGIDGTKRKRAFTAIFDMFQ